MSSIQRIYISVWVFYNFFSIRICTSVCVDYNGISAFDNIFYSKNVHLCASWLKWYVLHWKIFSTWGIHTSVGVFFIYFIEELPLSELTKVVFTTLETVFYQKNIYILCDLTKMFVSTLRNVFYPKNMHLCASILRFISLKNIYLCANWLKWYFYTWK